MGWTTQLGMTATASEASQRTVQSTLTPVPQSWHMQEAVVVEEAVVTTTASSKSTLPSWMQVG